jgi:hypothetical protein
LETFSDWSFSRSVEFAFANTRLGERRVLHRRLSMEEPSWDECSKCSLPSIPKKVLVIENEERCRWMLAYKLSNGNCRKRIMCDESVTDFF